MKLPILNLSGATEAELDLDLPIIENGRGSQAVHDFVVAYQAAQRSGTACTKNVGEVAGTNKKPWRQKGTGRARAGSFRSPLWRGGGVVFGPKPRDFRKKVSKGTRSLAFLKAISERLRDGSIKIVSQWSLSQPKTKELLSIVSSLSLKGTLLFVVDAGNRNLLLAARNLAGVEIVEQGSLNAYQLLRYDTIVFEKAAFEAVQQRITRNSQ